MSNGLLCLPIELYQREIDTRLMIALFALQNKYNVLIGHTKEKCFKSVKNSVFYFSPAYADTYYSAAKLFSLNNNKIILHDEEGFLRPNDNIYNKRIGKTAVELGDIHLAWNESQAELLRGKNCRNVMVAGSPKFELMKLCRNKSIRNSKKININTRFIYANPLSKIDEKQLFSTYKDMGLYSDDEYLKYKNKVECDKLVLNEFIKLIHLLGSDNKIPVSIRVHPAEDSGIYKKIIKKYTNIFVEKNLSLSRSLIDCSHLIHDGCTTALEALVMGRKVIALRPDSVGNYYNDYPNKISNYVFSDANQLYEYLTCSSDKNEDEFNELPLELKNVVELNYMSFLISILGAEISISPKWRYSSGLSNAIDTLRELAYLGAEISLSNMMSIIYDNHGRTKPITGKFPFYPTVSMIKKRIDQVIEDTEILLNCDIKISKVGQRAFMLSLK